jgi:hypothetical protein
VTRNNHGSKFDISQDVQQKKPGIGTRGIPWLKQSHRPKGRQNMAALSGTDDGSGYGVKGQSTGAIEAGDQGIGVWGVNSGTGIGVFGDGQNGIGVEGVSSSTETTLSTANSTNVGVMGSSAHGDGIFGSGARNGVHGQSASPADSGVWGENTGSGVGVAGSSVGGNGVLGTSASATSSGVWGNNTGAGTGVAGSSVGGNGVAGTSASATSSGVWGNNTGAGVGVAGSSKSGNAGEFSGNVLVTGTLTVNKDVILAGADCAEQFDTTETQLEPGTVVVIGQEGTLRESREAYDRRVAGVVSGAGAYKPAIVLDRRPPDKNRIPVALIGKVYCKVDAAYAAIEVGDLLTASPTPGHAMKAVEPSRTPGAVIGKALGPLPSGTALIPVLVALQ